MYQYSLLRLLLLPSLLSGSLVFFIAFGVMGYSSWLYISHNQLFYDYLFGAYGINTYVWSNSLDVWAWYGIFLGSPVAYYLLVGGVATAVGMAVFTLLQGTGLFFRGLAALLHQAHDPAQKHSVVFAELLGRIGLRTLSLIGWAVYAAAFVSSIYPTAVTVSQQGLEQWRQSAWQGALLCLGGALLLMLALHVHVIFARLCMLRPRVFGGDRAIEEAEAQSKHQLDA